MMLLMVGRNHALRLVVFYDGWLSFTMVVIPLLMDGCIMYGIWFHLFYCTLYHGSEEDDVFIFLCMYILLSPSYPVTCTVDDGAFRINFPRCIQKKCILNGHWTFLVFFHVDVVVVRLRIN